MLTPPQPESFELIPQLLQKMGRRVRFKRHHQVVRRGDRPETVLLVQDGWAARYSQMPDGRRHISHFYLPGDVCDLSWLVCARADQAVTALTPIKAISIDRSLMEQQLATDTRFAQGVAIDSLSRLEAQAAWMVTLGHRPAAERLAQLLCELYSRSERRGRTWNCECALPVSQQQLADYTGMSAVHVCRTLRRLREGKLLQLQNRKLRIPDFPYLASICRYGAGGHKPARRTVPANLSAPDPATDIYGLMDQHSQVG